MHILNHFVPAQDLPKLPARLQRFSWGLLVVFEQRSRAAWMALEEKVYILR